MMAMMAKPLMIDAFSFANRLFDIALGGEPAIGCSLRRQTLSVVNDVECRGLVIGIDKALK